MDKQYKLLELADGTFIYGEMLENCNRFIDLKDPCILIDNDNGSWTFMPYIPVPLLITNDSWSIKFYTSQLSATMDLDTPLNLHYVETITKLRELVISTDNQHRKIHKSKLN